ncbi:MAG: uridine diphosphate-N-acetylglucosamine-binding protein YvcK [Candidatus Buchananbacteria bacterium]|nr:uridine diphosphate-N-acetylglucosamine-binding protein YvcK [Candidatus Buchananbacteria bacterium]
MSGLKKITVIGGGTGSYTILTGLRNYPDLDLAAIVAMADDGGSTGVLRDELGALPPGDVRQCLVALSHSEDIWRQLFNHRFTEGSLAGQSFGNLFITALQQITDDFETALQRAGELLQVKGEVIPVTLDDVRLVAKTPDGQVIIGEHQIDLKNQPIESISFEPYPSANQRAIERILASDLIVICPGDIYTSILPNLLVENISDAINDSRAIKVYICNLMTQKNHTHGFRIIDFICLLEKYMGQNEVFDYVIYNNQKPAEDFLLSYAQEGEYPVEFSEQDFQDRKTKFLGKNLLSQKIPHKVKGDNLTRALIRHNSFTIASILYDLLKKRE